MEVIDHSQISPLKAGVVGTGVARDFLARKVRHSMRTLALPIRNFTTCSRTIPDRSSRDKA
jgi:hypothetical protein